MTVLGAGLVAGSALAVAVWPGGGTTPEQERPAAARATLSPSPANGTESVERTVTVSGMRRTYLAVGLPRKRDLPLIVVLHGRGFTAQQESVRTGFLTYAQRGLADLVYPQGTADSWNAGDGCCGRAGASGVNDIGFVTDVVGDATRFFGSDTKRVYLVGYSNGARLAFQEVCSQPALFAAFATYAGLPHAVCEAGEPVPVLVAAGTNDTLVRSEGSVSDVVGRWRARDGCGPTAGTVHTGPLTLTTWTGCRGGSAVASASYTGIGHHWPTAEPNPEPFTTVVGQRAATATVMWEFLTAHSR
ncbi:alpha/beta hydrolase family esterase [Amycolatopsis sp.]|uniref:alpha/beta hydrolase family esterase n=1 Tax=Amycolatopsis sp. TaxID=37632 RepID=UPI002B483D85|nr:PHB depolymerase family esterase [Amycolatopsis sp.]